MQNLLQELTELLSSDDRLVSEGRLMKNKIVELALAIDPLLMKHLLRNQSMRRHFFTEVEGAVVFDKIKFQRFVSNKSFLPDSYTAFKNKIGLTAGDHHLVDTKEVVLAWPFKDCVLEGGQDRDDARRKEIFWNETLAPDQIDRLLSPKALTNFKRCTDQGYTSLSSAQELDLANEQGLIVKGNNLLALHTLEKMYCGKVKLVYIDPPFNTESDSFQYNDAFNHSTWLTFIKNRLEIAKRLLRPDGAIFVHLDHAEAPYCKVLLDEIFGRENWLNTFTITTNDPSGFKATGKGVFSTANQLMFYAKNKSLLSLSKQYIPTEYDDNYGQYLINRNEPYEDWSYVPVTQKVAEDLGFKNQRTAKAKLGAATFDAAVADFAFKNAASVFRTAAIQGGARSKRIETIERSQEDRGRVFVHPGEDLKDFYILNGECILFYESRLIEIDGVKVAGKLLTDVWTDIKITGIADEGGVQLKNGKKPERLLKRVLDIATDDGDLVCDFFSGSGTTLAVAHKMGRRFIGVEQMSYVEDVTVRRLRNVVEGEQSGVSGLVSWKGGGSFLYCELAKANQVFVDKINEAKKTAELISLWDEMKDRAFLSYKVEVAAFDRSKTDFEALSLEDQKRFLLEVLDKNMLYVPLSEIEDKTFAISKEDRDLNHKFFRASVK